MKPFLFIVVLVLASSVALGQFKKGSVEDKLIQLDRAWTSAELKGDKKTVSALIADDFIGTTQRGIVENKAQYIASVVPNSDMVKSDDYKIRLYGGMAIMTHRSTIQGVRNIQFRSTHVWIRRGGKWLIIGHHGSQILPDDDDTEQ
ncbi:MAG: nuclear transport factor 2 family protein [Acidobacteriota bacterium]